MKRSVSQKGLLKKEFIEAPFSLSFSLPYTMKELEFVNTSICGLGQEHKFVDFLFRGF